MFLNSPHHHRLPKKKRAERQPHWWAILLPLTLLVGLQSWLIGVYGSDALNGASQVTLLLSAGLTFVIGRFIYHKDWSTFGKEIDANIGRIGSAMLILLMIGMLSGTWMVSGVVPTLISYGLNIISPKIFLLTACLISALVALMTGSSWTTIATIGIALIGIGNALGFAPGMTAGAIISGAYFGDKISPLSDTTVLASSSAGTPLFTHIRYMLRTTIPSISITLVLFLVLSLVHPVDATLGADEYNHLLHNTFHITPWLLLVPLLTGIMIARRVPAIHTLMASALLGAIAAVIAQPHILWHIATEQPLQAYQGASWNELLHGTFESFYNSTQILTGNAALDSLVSTRGMLGMLNTIFLIISAAVFGAGLVASGMLGAFTDHLIGMIHQRTSVVGSTVGLGILADLITGDQYLSIMLTCNIFRPLYESRGFDNKLLSRSAEDSATVTSVLIPWNSCGMTQAMVLGVGTLVYLPFCFFNLLSPVMSILAAIYDSRKEKRRSL